MQIHSVQKVLSDHINILSLKAEYTVIWERCRRL